MSALAAVLVTGAVLLWRPAAPWRRLRVRAPAARPEPSPRLVPLLVVGVVTAVVCGAALNGLQGGVLGLAAGASVAVVGCTLAHARATRRRNRARDEVARGCSELAALLRAGHPPGRAVQLVADTARIFAEPAAQLAVGGDVVEALQRAARRPGCRGLQGLAGAWQVSERSGASMTASLDGLAAHLVAERELGRTVDTELAAARLTGRLLGLLPLVGIGLGSLVGGDPVGYLTASVPGLACLGIGIGFAVVGVVWSEKLADRATVLR